MNNIINPNGSEFKKKFLKECKLEYKLSEKREPVPNISIQSVDTSHPIYGKKIVMTKVRDKDIIDFLESHGATMENTMKKDTFVLIVKSKEDVSNKTEYATKNKIPIMTVEEFKQIYM